MAIFANCPGANNFTNCPVTDKSEFGPRHTLNQWQMAFDNPLGYILSISMCMQNFITIFHSVEEIGQFSLFQKLELGKASTDDKCNFAISCARSCQCQCAQFYQNIPNASRVVGIFRELPENSQIDRGRIRTIIGHLKVNLQLTFSGSCNSPICALKMRQYFYKILFLLGYKWYILSTLQNVAKVKNECLTNGCLKKLQFHFLRDFWGKSNYVGLINVSCEH